MTDTAPDLPAFPANHFDLADNEHGMTMRDYFAAKATDEDVQAMRHLVPPCDRVVGDGFGSKRVVLGCAPDNWRALARYLHADAMLKAREVKP
jgi:hypothetical protein